jgi:hypothetical protein
MSKKWNTRAPSAFSSAIAVVILLSAGAAVAQQGGLERLAAGAGDAVHGQDHSAAAKEAAMYATQGTATSHGSGQTGNGGGTGTPPDTCAITVAGVRGAMPAAGDTTGIVHAISVLSANCANDPQAHGLINALQKLGQGSGQGSGHGPKGHGAGPPPGHTNQGHNGGGSNGGGGGNGGGGNGNGGGGNGGGNGGGSGGSSHPPHPTKPPKPTKPTKPTKPRHPAKPSHPTH